jgi:hypothetical protein
MLLVVVDDGNNRYCAADSTTMSVEHPTCCTRMLLGGRTDIAQVQVFSQTGSEPATPQQHQTPTWRQKLTLSG